MGPKRQKAGTGGNRPRKKKRTSGYGDSHSEHEDEAGPSNTRRNQMMIDDDDDDIQGAYEEADGQYLEGIFIPPKYTRVEQPQTGERLVIEKIVCENFKSYGGVKEMGPFHKSFSAIVGPNGNGKSNIIDAMLFVFGYRAAKIRCKKVSVLIHKSELLPSLTCCAVTVHFVKIIDNGQNDDTFEVVPNSRITVTRRANSDNSSGYSLDGKKVNFNQVASFLKINGIDIVHNRFLILQGEVESIAQMPPKTPNGLETGLLEFLEEVIGTKRYLKCLVELEQKVEQLDYEREEKLHRVDLVEKEKQAMHEPVKVAKDYLRDHNTKSRCHHQICQLRISHAKTKCDDITTRVAPLQGNIQSVNSRLQEIKVINEQRKSEYGKEEKDYNKKKTSLDNKKKVLETNEAEYVKYYENISRDNEQRKKLMKDKAKKEKEIEKLDEIPQQNDGEKAKLEKRKAELDEEINQEEDVVKREMVKLNEKINALLKKKVQVDKEYNDWLPERHKKKMSVELLQREIDAYKNTQVNEDQKLEQYLKELHDLEEDIRKRERQARSSMEGKIGGIQTSLEEKKRELDGVKRQEETKKREMATVSNDLDEARESLECSATDRTYQLFFSEKEQGRLQGVHGRLKDLATVDEKYNVAVTVSTGMLDYWVVDHDDTATACIELLRQKKITYQNFICLNRLQKPAQEMKQRFDTPPNSHRLFDLLQISIPEVRPAFYKALRDTLVTENLDVGSRIAYGPRRHRVATVSGELIEPSGAMTGGGRAKIQGKMNSGMAARLTSKYSRADYEEIKRRYDSLSKELQQLSSRRLTLDGEIYQMQIEIKTIEDKIKNFHSDLESLKKQLPYKQKRAKDQEAVAKAAAVDPKVLKQKEKDVAAAAKDYEDTMERSKGAEEAAAKVHQDLDELQINKRNEIRRRLEKFLAQRKKVDEEIDKIVVDLKNYQKNKNKAAEKIKALEKDIEKLQKNMEKWSQARKDIEENSKVLKAEYEELVVQVDQAKEELQKKKDVLNEFKDEEKELAKSKVELDAKIEEMSGKLKQYQREIKQNQHTMAGLELKEIPEEEVAPLVELSEDELKALNQNDLQRRLDKYEKKLQRESPNLNILEEYKKKVDVFLARVEELDAVTARRDKFREAYLNTTAQRLAEFMEGFAVISSKLKEMFRMISMGGDAELDLVDSTDPFSSGVQFSVRPARKTWKKISNLSGGEKTLSSLALIFALHYFKPSPFYVMDEIDAALDFKNVSIIANYIKDRTKFTQFIIISLRSNMFELADSLLGVYKVDNMSYSIHIGVSKMLSIMRTKFDEAGKPFPLDTQGTQQQQTQNTNAKPGTSTVAGSSSQPSGQHQEPGSSQGLSVRNQNGDENNKEKENSAETAAKNGESSNTNGQGPVSTPTVPRKASIRPSMGSAIGSPGTVLSGKDDDGEDGDDEGNENDDQNDSNLSEASTVDSADDRDDDEMGIPLSTSTPRHTIRTSTNRPNRLSANANLTDVGRENTSGSDEDDDDVEMLPKSPILSGANSDGGDSADFEFD